MATIVASSTFAVRETASLGIMGYAIIQYGKRSSVVFLSTHLCIFYTFIHICTYTHHDIYIHEYIYIQMFIYVHVNVRYFEKFSTSEWIKTDCLSNLYKWLIYRCKYTCCSLFASMIYTFEYSFAYLLYSWMLRKVTIK